jgi:hypothetical protein
VADFVGAGRTLRRLDLLTAADAVAATSWSAGEGPAVRPYATLAEVMAALLTSDAPAIRVVDNGAVAGVVTLESIRAALRHDSAVGGEDAGAGEGAAEEPPPGEGTR